MWAGPRGHFSFGVYRVFKAWGSLGAHAVGQGLQERRESAQDVYEVLAE